MAEKKKLYQAETMALPPLKMVLGELPEPDPGQGYRPFQALGIKNEEARGVVNRLIGHIKDQQ